MEVQYCTTKVCPLALAFVINFVSGHEMNLAYDAIDCSLPVVSGVGHMVN